MTTETTIRRNKDGKQNLIDLRKELEERTDVRLHKMGGNWILNQWSEGHQAWWENPLPWHFDERAAIQHALYGECESEDETEFYRQR